MNIDVCMCFRTEKEKSVTKQQDNIYFKTMNGVCVCVCVCVCERERERERVFKKPKKSEGTFPFENLPVGIPPLKSLP